MHKQIAWYLTVNISQHTVMTTPSVVVQKLRSCHPHYLYIFHNYILLEQVTVTKLIMRFPKFYGTQIHYNVHRSPKMVSIPGENIQFISSYPASLRYSLMLTSSPHQAKLMHQVLGPKNDDTEKNSVFLLNT
jgi:hypothetical protein